MEDYHFFVGKTKIGGGGLEGDFLKTPNRRGLTCSNNELLDYPKMT